MVAIRNIFTAALALAAPISAALTPAQIVDNIKMLTTKSQALQGPAQSITIINGPLIVIGQGPFPQIIAGFTDIVTTTTTAISQMQGTQPVKAGADADAIFDAFREVSAISPHNDQKLTKKPVCPRPPSSLEHPHRQGWSLHHYPLHRSACCSCPQAGRGRCRRK